MHDENDIKKAAKILLERYGELDTKEIKERLIETIELDDDDMQPSLTRTRKGGQPEPKIEQIIRNVVSHGKKGEKIHYFTEGFAINRSVKPAIWFAFDGLMNPVVNKTKNIAKRKNLKKTKRTYRKINWDEVNERQSSLGIAGEEFVYLTEVEKVKQIDLSLVDKVQHLSAYQGDGFGYDILSIDCNTGNPIYIEVKTTTSHNSSTAFYMSVNERDFFEEHKNDNSAFVYRVYDFDQNQRRGKILIISAKELLEDYYFDPISFRVTKKTE